MDRQTAVAKTTWHELRKNFRIASAACRRRTNSRNLADHQGSYPGAPPGQIGGIVAYEQAPPSVWEGGVNRRDVEPQQRQGLPQLSVFRARGVVRLWRGVWDGWGVCLHRRILRRSPTPTARECRTRPRRQGQGLLGAGDMRTSKATPNKLWRDTVRTQEKQVNISGIVSSLGKKQKPA